MDGAAGTAARGPAPRRGRCDERRRLALAPAPPLPDCRAGLATFADSSCRPASRPRHSGERCAEPGPARAGSARLDRSARTKVAPNCRRRPRSACARTGGGVPARGAVGRCRRRAYPALRSGARTGLGQSGWERRDDRRVPADGEAGGPEAGGRADAVAPLQRADASVGTVASTARPPPRRPRSPAPALMTRHTTRPGWGRIRVAAGAHRGSGAGRGARRVAETDTRGARPRGHAVTPGPRPGTRPPPRGRARSGRAGRCARRPGCGPPARRATGAPPRPPPRA